MHEITTGTLFTILAGLIVLSGFFSGSETGLMTLNRYRLRHRAEKGHRGARLARQLLRRPDRLLGMILLGNNIVNIFAATIATVIALRLYGELGIAVAPFVLTFVILVFAEVAPKTLAALKPESIAYPAAYLYTLLAKPFYPFVVMINSISNGMLALFGVNATRARGDRLSSDELRAVVHEANQFIPGKHTEMLLRVLDLESISIEDIMIPRNEITGIDIHDNWSEILQQITNIHRTRVPVYRDNIDDIVGFLHMRKVLNLVARDELNMETLESMISEPYFIPEGTSLIQQLRNFQKNHRRSGLAVDEYGSILGLVTLEDILEEIVGQFTTDSTTLSNDIYLQEDGSCLVEGSVHIRDINRTLSIHLPTDGPKTLNGLIIEYLEMIPEPGTSVLIANHPIEITRASNYAVEAARILPALTRPEQPEPEAQD